MYQDCGFSFVVVEKFGWLSLLRPCMCPLCGIELTLGICAGKSKLPQQLSGFRTAPEAGQGAEVNGSLL